jgi:hypothetical protein
MTAIRSLPGWFSNGYAFQEEVVQRYLPQGGTYLEVGTFLGASLAHIGSLRPDINLIAVDPWIDEPGGEQSVGPLPGGGFKHRGWDGLGCYADVVRDNGGNMWDAFHRLMGREAPDVLRRTNVMRGTAATIRLTEPVDVLFVDGAHDYPNVKADLDAFVPLVKPGGLISGHDFDGFWPGVVQAVTERFGQPQTMSTCWWVEA